LIAILFGKSPPQPKEVFLTGGHSLFISS